MASDDPLAALVERIKGIVSERGTPRFSNKQLRDLSSIYERYGYAAARQYLIGKTKGRGSDQSKALLQVLDEIEQGKMSREIGAYILRKLNPILSFEEGG